MTADERSFAFLVELKFKQPTIIRKEKKRYHGSMAGTMDFKSYHAFTFSLLALLCFALICMGMVVFIIILTLSISLGRFFHWRGRHGVDNSRLVRVQGQTMRKSQVLMCIMLVSNDSLTMTVAF